jgi:hypothetical protein
VNVSLFKRLLLLILFALAVVPASAHALQIPPGGVSLEALNEAGEAQTQAGSHPDRLIQGVEFADPEGTGEEAKEMVLDLPPGLSGDPGAVPSCPRQAFDESVFSGEGCKPESQVGRAIVDVGGSENSTPLYSVEAGPNEVALFGTSGLFTHLKLIAHLRPTDQGLSMHLSDLPQNSERSISAVHIELWGIPADHQEETSIPRTPLLTLPSRCDGGPLTSTTTVRTWQQPERWVTGSGNTGQPLSGCGSLAFDPAIAFSLGTPSADTPTGATIDLNVPQDEDPDGLATSQVRNLSVALPEGMTISPGGAQGLATCTDAQLGLGTEADPTCPPASRVGSMELNVPALSKPMAGSIYLGTERPGERFRLFIAASAQGSEVKFAGSLQSDPATGRLTATLNDLPQASFTQMSLHFNGGPGSLLASPLTCGPATANATLTPYSGTSAVARSATAAVSASGGGPCAAIPFAPTLSAGSTTTRPGAPTAFSATITRKDGEALPERLDIALPPGIGAALGKVTPCTATAAASGSCPPSSQVGSALAELGPGPQPAQLKGTISLTGPYRHAPFGIAIAFKAALGPFDLGTLILRGALRIDPRTGQVTIATDPLPSSFEGIPIRFQTLGLDLNRPGFIRNPTSCAPAEVKATLSSEGGSVAHPTSPFSLRGCIDLPFHPHLAMSLTDSSQLHPGGKPSLTVRTHVPPGDANLRSLDLLLPKALKLDPSALREHCSRRAAAHRSWPPATKVGTASAHTPLLEGVMQGSIYLAQPQGNGSPDLWAQLQGSGIEVALHGETAVKDGRAETTFAHTPDFPLASFSLRFGGGPHGLLALKRSPCAGLSTSARIGGQSGAVVGKRVGVGVGCIAPSRHG